MSSTSISFPLGLGYVSYEKEYISSILESKLRMVPGFERLAKVITIENSDEKNSFLFLKDAKGITLIIHVVVIPRTQMVAVAEDIKELLFYVFKKDLGVELSKVKIYIEAN